MARDRSNGGNSVHEFTQAWAEKSFAVRYPQGSMLFGQGDAADRMYCIKKGIVKLMMVKIDGTERTLRFVRSGDVFGICGLFANRTYGVGAIAFTDCLITSFAKEEVMARMASDSQFALNCARLLADQLWMYGRKDGNLSLESLPRKVISTLVTLAKETREQDARKEGCRVQITHQELANYVGASRVGVTVVLADLERRGLVVTRFRQVVIPDLHLLRQFGNRSVEECGSGFLVKSTSAE